MGSSYLGSREASRSCSQAIGLGCSHLRAEHPRRLPYVMHRLVLVVHGWPWFSPLGSLECPCNMLASFFQAEEQMEATPYHLSRVCHHRNQLIPRGRRLHVDVSSVEGHPEGCCGLNCVPLKSPCQCPNAQYLRM